MSNLTFEPNPYSGEDYKIVIDSKKCGECSREVLDIVTSMGSETTTIQVYEEIHKELDTLKWIGEDEGWELAISAVQRMLLKKAKDLK